jgi:hypothetical protein
MSQELRCLFCQQRDAKISVEHILSASIRRHIGGTDYTATIYRQPKGGRLEQRGEFETPTPTFTRRIYCELCNNGWMQEMDVAAEPVLGPLIHGEDARLSLDDQKQLATWSWKVALVCESLAGASRQVPDDEFHRFFLDRRPPPGEPIDLMHYTGGTIRHEYARREITQTADVEVPRAHAVLITVIIEQFVMQTSVPVTGLARRAIINADDRVVIWPSTIQGVRWPPPIGFDDDRLRMLTTQDWPN